MYIAGCPRQEGCFPGLQASAPPYGQIAFDLATAFRVSEIFVYIALDDFDLTRQNQRNGHGARMIVERHVFSGLQKHQPRARAAIVQ